MAATGPGRPGIANEDGKRTGDFEGGASAACWLGKESRRWGPGKKTGAQRKEIIFEGGILKDRRF